MNGQVQATSERPIEAPAQDTTSSDSVAVAIPPPVSVVAEAHKGAKLDKATSTASASRQGGYVVQLIATNSPDKARELKRRLDALKLPAYTEKTPDGSKIRVRVGPFPQQEAAEAARARPRDFPNLLQIVMAGLVARADFFIGHIHAQADLPRRILRRSRGAERVGRRAIIGDAVPQEHAAVAGGVHPGRVSDKGGGR